MYLFYYTPHNVGYDSFFQVLMELEATYHDNRELHTENMTLSHKAHDSDEYVTLLRAKVRHLELELQKSNG